MIGKMIFSIVLILSGLSLGYSVRLLTEKGKLDFFTDLPELRKTLQKGVLLYIIPITVMGALWIVDFNDSRLIFFPAMGIVHYFAGGFLAIAAAVAMKAERKKTGSLFCSGFFTNIGSVGGLITFILIGEEGYALVPFYKLFAEVTYYSVGFPIASYFGQKRQGKESFPEVISRLARDPFIRAAVSAVVIGTFLNFTDIERPEFYSYVNALLIPFASFVMLTAIGLGMRFSRIRYYLKEIFCIVVIRSALLPAILITLALIAGFGEVSSGLPLKVVIVLSFMPAAFITLLPASIYDLDLDLANACWLASTLSVIIFIPVIYQLINLLT